ncbi:MAG: DivIVA domain-containing protein [Acidimicrobiia bacterium]
MDEVEPAGSSDAPRLSPGEIAYHEFARAPDGLDEGDVRDFLGQVADLIAAGREREQRLAERVRELEARGPSGATPSTDTLDPRTEALFAQLRESGDAPEPAAPTPAARSKARAASPKTPEPAEAPTAAGPAADPQPAAEPSADDRIRARRDPLLESLTADLLRTAKRLLQDEQNVLLDAARRARSRVDPERLLPDPEHHREAWAAVLTPALDAAYGGGRMVSGKSRKASDAPERVVNELAAGLIAPLRERLVTTLGSVVARGPYESSAELHRELVSAVGARYREWRSADLEIRLGDALAAAYTRGAYDGAPSGAQLRWIPVSGQRCPDCEDNSLEPTVKGQHFPTGQPHPPAHPGCRCLVLPVEADRGDDSAST